MKEFECMICGCIGTEDETGYYPVGEDGMCRECKKRMYDKVDYDWSISPRNPYSPIGIAVAKVIEKKFPWLGAGESDDLYDVTDHVLNFAWIEKEATPDLNKLVGCYRKNKIFTKMLEDEYVLGRNVHYEF